MRAEEYFATEWPAEVPRLRRLLARNGISIDALDDVLQEAALRLYMAWDRVFEDRPMKPLVNTIVLNVARDHHRRTHYEVRPVAEIPDVASVDAPGAEQVAMARLELARAGRALAALTEQQRDVVVRAVADELAGEQHGRVRAPAATRMAITRARRRLVEVLEVTAAAVGITAGVVSQASRRPGVRPTVAAGALVLAAAVFIGGGVVGSTPEGSPDVSETTPVAHNAAGSSRSGVSEWQYQDTSPALDVGSFGDDYAGTSRWNWQSPLLWVGAGGTQLSLGPDSAQTPCRSTILNRVELRYHCLPVISPAGTNTNR